ncbi:MAG: BMP family ABC transporter substrate-binding protein [Erysipelotrichaceae bacterium]|nr:BMP family ABC transporter substrate-binding protein [Erysipelotrichaceae bacterium]
MKKLLSLLLAALLVITMTGCNNGGGGEGGEKEDKLKIGVILVGDENEGYTFAHMEGIRAAMKANGLSDDQVIWKYSIGESQDCYDSAVDLVEQGCKAVFSNSYGHQPFMQQAASEYPDVKFVAATGDTAALSGLNNFSNAFTNVYESRYVSGIVAGMKLAELEAAGQIPAESYKDGKVLIGYVGAYPYAEVVSGFTAFFLGVKSVFPNVTMEVIFTNSWFNITAEGETANTLMADHCVIIGQHADSTGAPAAVEAALAKGTVAYSVGYNVDMLAVAPNAALTSATNNWAVYYTYAFGQVVKGEKIATDWAEGYKTGAVAITALGPNCAPGTQEAVDKAIAAIKSGELHVFDTSTWTVNGEHLTELKIDLTGDFDTDDAADKNAIFDGYFHESEFRSAPSFSIYVDGIFEK